MKPDLETENILLKGYLEVLQKGYNLLIDTIRGSGLEVDEIVKAIEEYKLKKLSE